MSKHAELESGAQARLHDTKTRDLLDAAAEQQFREAVRQLVRSRSYDEIRRLLDEELEGVPD